MATFTFLTVMAADGKNGMSDTRFPCLYYIFDQITSFNDSYCLLFSGRVCVPINHAKVEEFNPLTVPTIRCV